MSLKLKRIMYMIGYFLFAAVFPLGIVAWKYDVFQKVEQASEVVKIAGVFIFAAIIVLFSIRKTISRWIHEMEPGPTQIVLNIIKVLMPFILIEIVLRLSIHNAETALFVTDAIFIGNAIAVIVFDPKITKTTEEIKKSKRQGELAEVLERYLPK